MLNSSRKSLWARFLGRQTDTVANRKQRRRSFFETLEARQVMAAITGGTGPGGFELANGASTLALWLDSTDIDGNSAPDVLAGGSAINTWVDRSGYLRNATLTPGTAPTYVTASAPGNNLPSVAFAAAGTELTTAYNFDSLGANYSVFAVSRYTGGANNRIISSETRNWLFGHWSSGDERWHADAWIQMTGSASTAFNVYSGVIGTATVLTANAADPGADFWKNGTQLADNNLGSNNTTYKPGRIALGRYGVNNTEASNGEVSELVIIDRNVNEAERRIIENALAAKYNLTIAAAQDVYAGATLVNGNFDFDVFGIGRVNATNTRLASGRSGFGIEVASFVEDGDFVTAGHKTVTNSIVSTGLPANVARRFSRSWFVDETDLNNNVAATFAFDFSDAGVALTGTNNVYTLLRSVDGGVNFTAVPGAATVAGDTISFNVSAAELSDAVYTLGFSDAPQLAPSAGAFAYVIGAPAVNIGGAPTAITVTDSDTQLTGATVSISGFVNGNADVLSFTPVGAITGVYNNTTGVLTLSGTDSPANYQTALQSVTFSKAAFQATPTRSVLFSTTDSTGLVSNAATRTVSIASGTFTWDGNSDADGDGITWTDGLNWVGNVAPGPNDLAIFANLDVGAVNVPSAVSIGSIQFANTAGSFALNQITGGVLTLTAGGLTQSGTSSNFINVPTVLPATTSIDVIAGASLSIDGTLTGAGVVAKSGVGTLIVGGNNTALSGTFSVNAGTVQGQISGAVAASTNPFGTAGIVINGGSLVYNRTSLLEAGINRKRVTQTAQPTTTLINYDLAGTTFVDTQVSGSAAAPAGLGVGHRWTGFVNITTAGNYLFRTNTDDGSRLYIDGILVVNSDGGHGVIDKTSLSVALTSGLHRIQMDYAEGSAAGNGGYSLSYSGPDQPAFGLIPAAVLFQSVPVTFGNSVTVTSAGGNLDLAGNLPGLSLGTLNIGAAGTTNFTVNAGSGRRLDFAGTNLQANNATVNLNVGQYVGLGRAQDGAASGVTLNKIGTGQLILDNNAAVATANDLNGTTLRISAGRLVNYASNVAGSTIPIAGANIEINGGTLALDTKIGDYAITNNITVTTSGSIDVVPGAVTLSHNTGVVTIPAGQTLTYNNYIGDAQVRGSLLEVNAQITGAGNLISNGVIGNAEDGNTANTAFLRLRNNLNSYTGSTTINGGSLIAFASNALGATSGDTLVNSGGQLRLENGVTIPAGETITINGTGPGTTLGSLRNDTANNVITDKVILGSASLLTSATAAVGLTLTNGLDVTAGNVTFDGVGNFTLPAGTGNITASANENGFIKTGTGTLTLAGTASTYTGYSGIHGGTVNVGSLSNYGVAGSLGARTLAMESNVGDDIGIWFRNNGVLQYTGATAQSTDRQMRIQTTGGVIDASGSIAAATVTFSYGGANINLFDTAGLRTLTLTGSNTGNNVLNTLLTDQAANATSLSKTGAGLWSLTNGGNIYSGSTAISNGTLSIGVNGALGTVAGPTTVFEGGTLRLTGVNYSTAEPLNLVGGGFVSGTGIDALQGALESTAGNNTFAGPISIPNDMGARIRSTTVGNSLTLSGAISASNPLLFAGAGDFNVSGNISGLGFNEFQNSALVRRRFSSANNENVIASPNFLNVLDTGLTLGNTTTLDNTLVNLNAWADNTTFVYTGQVFDADGIFSFAESIDDVALVRIDGVTYLRNVASNLPSSTGSAVNNVFGGTTNFGMGPNGDGWHDIEVRFGNGTGGAGATVSGSTGWNASAAPAGHGFGFSATGSTTLLGTDYVELGEVGGPAFRTRGNNSLTKIGAGTLTLSGTGNTYGGLLSVEQGTVIAAHSSALGNSTGGTTVLAGAMLNVQGGSILADALSVNGSGIGGLGVINNVSGSNTLSGNIAALTESTALTFGSQAGTLNISGNINLNFASLTVIGAGNTSITGNISGAGANAGRSYAQEVQADDPLYFYQFNEGSGFVANDSGLRDNDGTIINARYFGSGTGRSGLAGDNSLRFEGASDNQSVEVLSARVGELLSVTGNNRVTVSLWQFGDAALGTVAQGGTAAADNSAFYGGQTTAGGGNRVFNTHLNWTDGNVYWDAGNGAGGPSRINAVPGATSQFKGQWNNWVFVKDGTTDTMQAYVNGTLFLSGAGKTDDFINLLSNWVGSAPNAASSYWGRLDDVALFSQALSPARVTQLFNAASASQTNLVANNSVIKNGAGTLTLGGTNTYNGTTAVNAGVLLVQNGAAIDNAAGAVSVANLATFQLLSSETISSYVGADDGANENDSVLALGVNTLTTVGSATIANVTSANGSLIAGTDIIDGDTDINVTGTGVYLGATNSVGSLANPLETSVANLEGNSGTGFFVASTTDVNIGGVTAAAGIASTGDVLVTSPSLLTVSENISGTGAGTDITLTTIDGGGAGQNLTVNATATISTPAGLIVLNAGDNATILGTLVSGNTITVNIDAGNADAGVGGVLTFDGDVDAPLAVFNGLGDTNGDSFDVRPDQDVGDVLTPIQVFGLAPVAGAFPVGDRLIVDIAGLGVPTLTLGPGLRNGSFGFGALAAPLTYNNIETVESDPPGATYHLVLDMRYSGFENGAADMILAQLNAAGTDLIVDVNGGNVFTGADADIQSLTIIGSNDDDALTIQETPGGLPKFLGAAPAVDNTGIGGGISAGSHLNSSADLVLETQQAGSTPWDAADVTLHFDGGVGGNDSLAVNFTTGNTTGYFSDTNDAGNSGNVSAAPLLGAPTLLLSFANVEPLILTGASGLLVTDATGTPATSSLTLTDIGTQTQIVGNGGFAPTSFSGFNAAVVAGGGGSETLEIVSVDNVLLTGVTLVGGNTNDLLSLPGGDLAADTLRIHSLPATVAATLNGNAGNDLFQLFDGANAVDNIAGNVTVDGTDGNVGGNTDTLTIINTGGGSADAAVIAAVNPGASQDYYVDGVTTAVSEDVIFRNIDVLNYTATTLDDSIDARLQNTTPTQHDLSTVNLSGWMGADQFLLFTSDQVGGTGAFNTPTGVASGVANVNLYGDALGNPNAGDVIDTFGATPMGVTGTGATNVGLLVADSTRMIRPSTSTAIAIDGGQPTGLAAPLGDVIGDTLNVDVSALSNATPVIVSTFSPGTVVATGISPLTWTQIEDLNLVDQGRLTNVQMGDLFARSTPNADLIQITRNPTALNPNQVRLRITASIGNYSVSNKTIMYGGAQNDTLTQSNLTIPAEFYGEAGDDYLTGAMNNDWLVGGDGNDRINGSGGDNVIWGDNAPTSADPTPQNALTGGDDQLSGLGGNDVFYGSGGNDLVSAGGGNDYVNGGAGNDTLDGHDGDDRIYGGAGNDVIGGHAGNDLLSGGDGEDRLYGAAGNDVILAGDGADLLDGGDGNDLLVNGIVANESSTWTSVASTATYSAATYTNGGDNDAALLLLLTQWGAVSDPSSIGVITHDGDNDDLFGGTGDDDFCWETLDVQPSLTPSDYNGFGMGTDQRIPPL